MRAVLQGSAGALCPRLEIYYINGSCVCGPAARKGGEAQRGKVEIKANVNVKVKIKAGANPGSSLSVAIKANRACVFLAPAEPSQ